MLGSVSGEVGVGCVRMEGAIPTIGEEGRRAVGAHWLEGSELRSHREQRRITAGCMGGTIMRHVGRRGVTMTDWRVPGGGVIGGE